MTLTSPGFVGRRLTEARRARGISAADLAGMVGVSAVSISKYENGHQTPRLDVFHSLASTLNMSRSYFLRAVGEEDQRPVFWRGKLSAPPIMRERAGVRLEWMKDVVDYVASYFDLPELNVPEFKVSSVEEIDTDFLEEVALALRAHWDIRPGPMPDVIEKLETNGVLVSRIHVHAEKLDAFSQWSDRFGVPFIVLGRDKASAVRQRFDALHELAHILLHRTLPQRRLNDAACYKLVEKQADRLAGMLLLPAKEFSEELYAPSLDGFLTMKERWGASVGAMISRCKSLDIIDDEGARRMWINYNRREWRKGEPLDGKLVKEEPHILRRSFELLISENVQSVSDILTALPFPATDLEEITDLAPGTLTGITESRAEPVFKPQFRSGDDDNNIINLFEKGRG